MNNLISKKLCLLEKRIIQVIEAFERNKKQKENLQKKFEIYKKNLKDKTKKEKEFLSKKILNLQEEREEIKHRIKKLLHDISEVDNTFLQA